MTEAERIIAKLDLEPLPGEGGYFRRTYDHATRVPGRQTPIASAIYYLVTAANFSALHRLDSDELYHAYAGDAAELIQLSPDGVFTKTILGGDVLGGQTPQRLVPAHHWQGLRVREGGRWALVGTTVSPAFEYEGFELAPWSFPDLYPACAAELRRFVRDE